MQNLHSECAFAALSMRGKAQQFVKQRFDFCDQSPWAVSSIAFQLRLPSLVDFACGKTITMPF
mgnify:CR=1 FL=1